MRRRTAASRRRRDTAVGDGVSDVGINKNTDLAHAALAPGTTVSPAHEPRVVLGLEPDEDSARTDEIATLGLVETAGDGDEGTTGDGLEDDVGVVGVAQMETGMGGLLHGEDRPWPGPFIVVPCSLFLTARFFMVPSLVLLCQRGETALPRSSPPLLTVAHSGHR